MGDGSLNRFYPVEVYGFGKALLKCQVALDHSTIFANGFRVSRISDGDICAAVCRGAWKER
jgi:hypothetical protein